MDVLRLSRGRRTTYERGPFVNGEPLIGTLREFERPLAEAEGNPGIAGEYMAFGPAKMYLPSRRLLGEADEYDDFAGTGKVTLLDCSCGNPGCWPLGVRIEVGEAWVTRSGFENLHRPGWSYARFGPFAFDLDDYLAELEDRPRCDWPPCDRPRREIEPKDVASGPDSDGSHLSNGIDP